MSDPKYQPAEESYKPLFPQQKGIHLHCSNCKNDIDYDDINIDKAIAKCRHCKTVFSFDQELKNVRQRPEVFMPEGIELTEFRSELDIRYRWRQANGLNGFLVFFTLFWNVMLLPFIIMAVVSGQYMILLGTSLHLIIGLSLLYYVITTLLNTTYITVDEYNLSIEHRPLKIPFFYPDRFIETPLIQQLYVRKYTASKTNGRPNYAYAVHLVEKGGKDTPILKGFKSKEKALYLEQEIERYLQIVDRRLGEEDHF